MKFSSWSWSLALTLMAVATSAHADDPILVVDDASIAPTAVFSATAVQGAKVLGPQRGVGLDGTLRESGLYGLSIAGNPWSQDSTASRGLGEIRVDLGSYAPTTVDLSLPCGGIPWVIGRSFNSRLGDSPSQGFQGQNWFQSSQPELIEDGNYIFIVYGADRYLTFKLVPESDVYRGVNGTAGAIEWGQAEDTGVDIYTYYDPNGNYAVFFGNDAGAASFQLWMMGSADGSATYVGGDTSYSAILSGYEVTGEILVAYDSAGRTYTYTYDAVGSFNRLTSVVATTVESSTTIEVGRVEYEYYTSSDSSANGHEGDLKIARVVTPLSTGQGDLTRETWYRYDSNHRVRMEVGPEGTRRAREASIDFDTAPETGTGSIVPYASLLIAYGSDSRVSQVTIPAGQSGSDVLASFSYDLQTSTPPTLYSPSWYSRTTVHDPQSYTTYYFDDALQPLSFVTTNYDLTDPSGTPAPARKKWVTRIVRDASGQITTVASPANADSYDHATGAITAKSTGKVTILNRVASPNVMQGFVASVAHQDGDGIGASALAYDAVLNYWAENTPVSGYGTVGGAFEVTRPLLWKRLSFPDKTNNPASTSALLTTTNYTFHSASSLAVETATTAYPVVSTAKNGPGGSALTTSSYFTLKGDLEFTKTRTGRIGFYQRDALTGLVTRYVRDAQDIMLTSYGATIPSGFHEDSTGEALNREYVFEYDRQGRRLTAMGPNLLTRFWFYGQLDDEEPFVLSGPDMQVQASPDPTKYFGPVAGVLLNHNGGVSASLTIGLDVANSNIGPSVFHTTSAPGTWLDTSDPTIPQAVQGLSTQTYGDIATWQYSPNGLQLESIRKYHHNPTTGGDGDATANYDETTFGYDLAGRLAKTITPAGTIDQYFYDLLNRPIAQKRGTNDGSPGNMTLTQSMQWDQALDGGNSVLTQINRYTNATDGPRTTDLFYDYNGDLIGLLNPTAPHAIFEHDNFGRLTEAALLGDTGFSPSSLPLDPMATSLANRVDLWKTSYDEVGEVYETSHYLIDQADGDIEGTAITTDVWHCPEGCVHAVSGESSVKIETDRECKVCVEYVTYGPISGDYEEATTIQSTDTVLEETHTIYNTIGEYVGTVSGIRTTTNVAEECIESGGGPLFLNEGASGSTALGLGLSHSNVPHRTTVGMIWRDDLRRPYWEQNLGDPSAPGASIPSPTAAPTGFTGLPDMTVPTRFTHYDPLGRKKAWLDLCGVALNSSGLPTTFPEVEGQSFEYEDGGRLHAEHAATDDSSSIAYSTCNSQPGKEYGYDKGRPALLKALVPGDPGYPAEDRTTEFVYPDHLFTPDGYYPSGSPMPKSDFNSNELMLCKVGPGGTTPTDLSVPQTDVEFFSYNAQGELKAQCDPAGYVGMIYRDGDGRLEKRSLIPPVTPPSITFDDNARDTEIEYDYMGRPKKVTSKNALGDVLSSQNWNRDNFGNLQWSSQDLGPTFAPGSSVSLPLLTVFDNEPAPSGAWQGIRRKGIDFGFDFQIDFKFGHGCTGSTLTNPIDLDAGLGRVSKIDIISGSPSSPIESPVARFGYHGIALPAWFELSPRTSSDPTYHSNWRTPDGLMYAGMVDSPDNGGQDRYGRPANEFWCAGSSSVCTPPAGEPAHNTDIEYDPSGRIIRKQDYIARAYSSTYKYPSDCVVTLGVSTQENPGFYGYAGGVTLLPTLPPIGEKWWFDANKNITKYRFDDDTSVDPTTVDSTDFIVNSTYNKNDRPTSIAKTIGGGTPSTSTPTHDLKGNITFDGKRYCQYDVDGRLVNVWHMEPGTGAKGVPWARFTYDCLGRMSSAVYHDIVAMGDDSLTADEIFNSEIMEFYAYDDKWRIVGVFRAGPVDPVTEARPEAVVYERFVYAAAGRNGMGDAWLLDCPVLSQIDADSNGSFERERRFLQNSMGDVIGVTENDHLSHLSESVRYTTWGYPILVPMDTRHYSDFDGDGDSGTDADLEAWFACLAGNCCQTCETTDVNRDGDFGTDADIEEFFAILAGHPTILEDISDNRFGFRGYWWDSHLELYHVRHRVYDPLAFRWLQPDPEGFVDGMNLYAYCGGDPINGIDPLGLADITKGETFHHMFHWRNLLYLANVGFYLLDPYYEYNQPGLTSPPGLPPGVAPQQPATRDKFAAEAERLQRILTNVDLSPEDRTRIQSLYENALANADTGNSAALGVNQTASNNEIDYGHTRRIYDWTLYEAKDGTITVMIDMSTAGFGASGHAGSEVLSAGLVIGASLAKGGRAELKAIDLGLDAAKVTVRGSKRLEGQVLVVEIELIQGNAGYTGMKNIPDHLKALGQANGAKSVRVEFTVANEKLARQIEQAFPIKPAPKGSKFQDSFDLDCP